MSYCDESEVTLQESLHVLCVVVNKTVRDDTAPRYVGLMQDDGQSQGFDDGRFGPPYSCCCTPRPGDGQGAGFSSARMVMILTSCFPAVRSVVCSESRLNGT